MVYETMIKTRFCETDMMGHINNTSYFIYLEQARVDMLFDLGIVSDQDSWNFVVVSIQCDFLSEILPNQLLTIQTQVSKIGRTSFILEHIILTEDAKHSAKAEVVMVKFNPKTRASEAFDQDTIDKLMPYFAK